MITDIPSHKKLNAIFARQAANKAAREARQTPKAEVVTKEPELVKIKSVNGQLINGDAPLLIVEQGRYALAINSNGLYEVLFFDGKDVTINYELENGMRGSVVCKELE